MRYPFLPIRKNISGPKTTSCQIPIQPSHFLLIKAATWSIFLLYHLPKEFPFIRHLQFCCFVPCTLDRLTGNPFQLQFLEYELENYYPKVMNYIRAAAEEQVLAELIYA